MPTGASAAMSNLPVTTQQSPAFLCTRLGYSYWEMMASFSVPSQQALKPPADKRSGPCPCATILMNMHYCLWLTFLCGDNNPSTSTNCVKGTVFALFGTCPFCHNVGRLGEVSMRGCVSHHVDSLSTQVSPVTRICLASLNSAFEGTQTAFITLFPHTHENKLL